MAKRQRKSQLGDTTCPVYTIKVTPVVPGSSGSLMVAKAVDQHKNYVGYVKAALEDGRFQVYASWVEPRHQRCGLGTKLYTAIAKWGCTKGVQLESDEIRSKHSQGFWEKQARKQRAYCTAPSEASPPTSDEPDIGRGSCSTYKLKCPVIDLTGARGPARKRRQR